MKLKGDHCSCSACGEYFNSTRAFDKHRTGPYGFGTRRCRSIAEMLGLGMAKNARGLWVTALRADSTYTQKPNAGDLHLPAHGEGVPT